MLLVGYKRFRYQIFRLIRLLFEDKLDYHVQGIGCNEGWKYLGRYGLFLIVGWLVLKKIQGRFLTWNRKYEEII